MSYDSYTDDSLADEMSQSLWNRAMSYDINGLAKAGNIVGSQSLWNRAMSYDQLEMSDN